MALLDGMGRIIIGVAGALLPLLIFFLVFQALYLKLPRVYIANLAKSMLLAFLGMVLFLQGVSVAFLPAGR